MLKRGQSYRIIDPIYIYIYFGICRNRKSNENFVHELKSSRVQDTHHLIRIYVFVSAEKIKRLRLLSTNNFTRNIDTMLIYFVSKLFHLNGTENLNQTIGFRYELNKFHKYCVENMNSHLCVE